MGSNGEHWIFRAWGGFRGVGGGYVAPRSGYVLYGEKIPRYGDVYPGKYPFRPPAENIRPVPPGCSSTSHPVLGKIKAPEEYPGLRFKFID